MKGAWVQSQVGELRSCIPCGTAKKKKKLRKKKWGVEAKEKTPLETEVSNDLNLLLQIGTGLSLFRRKRKSSLSSSQNLTFSRNTRQTGVTCKRKARLSGTEAPPGLLGEKVDPLTRHKTQKLEHA